MGLKDKKLISLQQIEGAVSPHQKQIDHALRARKEALEYVTDVSELARVYRWQDRIPGNW